MIIEFPQPTDEELIRNYWDYSESFTRLQHESFWREQKENNTRLWNLLGSETA